MAHSAREVLNKIGDLLVEINEEYASIEQREEQQDIIELSLLVAKAKYLTAHLEVLTHLSSKPVAPAVDTADTEETVFTPASVEDEEIDDQPVYEEIVEAEPMVEEELVADSTEGSSDDVIEEVEEKDTDTQRVGNGIDEEEIPATEEENSLDKYTEVEGESEPQDWEREEEENFDNEEDEDRPSDASVQEVASNRPQSEVVVSQVIEEEREVTVSEPEPTEPEETKPTRPLTLNEVIQQQKKAGLTNASQFSTSTKTDQILDLKSGVSLNDKLLFIKDLFNGYSLAYTEAIELLNRFDSFEEADAFLQANYAMKNNWHGKPQTVDKLYAILRKKYG